jgi:hypothetical protein
MAQYGSTDKGTTRLSEQQYVALVVRVVKNRHGGDVIARMPAYLAERANRVGPVDLSRNVVRSWNARVCRAYARTPLVSGLTEELALAMGDVSAVVTVDKFATVGGRPMPTTMIQASAEAQTFQEPAGYSAVRIGWSHRTGRIVLQVITPDDLDPEYSSDDPSEPTIIRHRGTRTVDGKVSDVVEVYDLTNPKDPSYIIWKGDTDVTAKVHGRTFTGAGYLTEWSFKDGAPYHPIVVRGHPRHIYNRLQQVEASLIVPIRWTAWGSGTDFASHPGRNVKGMVLAGQSSDTTQPGTGLADGPDVIKMWVDMDPDHAGEHWQDAPAFDPLTNAQAVGFYESLTLNMIDLPTQMDATGGDPTAQESAAREEAITATLIECRRFDGELLKRCAALANRLEAVQGDNIPEGPYGVLYRDEVTEILDAATKAEEAKAELTRAEEAANGGHRSGQPGGEDPGKTQGDGTVEDGS